MFGKDISLHDKVSFIIIIIGFFLILVLLPLNMKHKKEVYIGNNEIYYKLVSLDIKLDETNRLIKELQKNNKL